MVDTLFADVSEFQRPVNNTYPHRVLSIRSNDGTYRDRNFAANYAWAKKAHTEGRLDLLIVYFVWRPNWLDAVKTHKAMVGSPPPPFVVSMIDVESWGGQIRGNQSAGVNGARENLISWYGGNRKRVIGYANAGDFATLWPSRGDAKVILANYSSNPAFPGKIAHQFSSSHPTAPFGPCDINAADGLTPAQLAAALGVGAHPSPTTSDPLEEAMAFYKDKADFEKSLREIVAEEVHAQAVRSSLLPGEDAKTATSGHTIYTGALHALQDHEAAKK